MQDAYIIAGSRSAVGKATKGTLRDVRPDDLAAQVVRHLVASLPEFDPNLIHDVIVGNASPEAEQGLNVARLISLMGLSTEKVPGMTVNRYCSSGLETIAIATAKIRTGMQELIIAGGTESMSCMPMGGWRIVPNARVAKENPDWYWGMGLTAEAVANEFKVSREAQDAFAVRSHERAAAAIDNGRLQAGIAPIEFTRVDLDGDGKRRETHVKFEVDEGVRRGTSMEGLAKLRPVFAAGGSVTAGNSSQTSDGAAFVMVASERMVKELGVEPIARLKSYHVAALAPRIMGMGPVHAVPPALEKGRTQKRRHRLVGAQRGFCQPRRGRVQRTRARPRKSQRERRRHRPGTSTGVHRSQAHRSNAQRTQGPRWKARRGHHVCRHRPRGRRRH